MKIFFLGIFCLGVSLVYGQDLKLGKLFNNHMVMQRNTECKIWGTATPSSTITIRINNNTLTTTCEKDSNWMASLPSFPAGGPHTINISSNKQIINLNDVLFGDVYIASGQSNMDFKMKEGVLNGDMEIQNANFPNIRHFEIPNSVSLKPKKELTGGNWLVCTPENVKEFSAIAYFFAREINQKTNIPIGIINSSWGGSRIEAWMPKEALERLPHQNGPVIQDIQSGKYTMSEYLKINESKVDTIIDITENSYNGVKISTAKSIDETDWQTVIIPEWGKVEKNEVWWLRKTIEVPKELTNKSVTLSLGIPGTYATIYINGKKACLSTGKKLHTTIEKGFLKTGTNLITIRLANTWWYPFIMGTPDDLFIADENTKVSLAGEWLYNDKLEPSLPKIYDLQHIASILYNAMICPLQNYAIKGVIWYQGENNGNEGSEYRELFPALINQWRIDWKQGSFPFLFVQLANYNAQDSLPQPGGWAELREAQFQSLKLPQTGMASAIDIGEFDNIHPKNKQDVGKRLALNALNMVYGYKDMVFKGPEYKSHSISGNTIVIEFNEVAEGLSSPFGKELPGFAIAGADSIFYVAKAKLENNKVIVKSKNVDKPVAVRYGWSANPISSLFNSADLPAVPFRTDNWEKFKVNRKR
ncbi:MAG: sialate O-acetylesterase [Prolixibacteraceae bacterium]